MNPQVVRAILRKDVTAFGRDRFFVFLTAVGVVLYPVLFWLLPGTVDETLRLGIAPASIERLIAAGAEDGSGLATIGYDDPASLEAAVLAGSDGIVAGITFPDDFLAATAAGEQTTVALLLTADVPPPVEDLMRGLVSEVAFGVVGEAPPVDPLTEAVVLGEDRVGDQITFREQLRPLLAFFVLLVETLALSALVASEVQQRTVTAILVTPATKTDFIAAKGILGTAVAFVEAVLIMALIGGFATQAPILLVALLLGAALVTGLGLVAGAFGKDFISVLFLSVAFMIPLMIPAFAAMFPGSAGFWVRALPSYPLVDTIVSVTTQGAGWGDVARNLALLLGWCVAAFAVGVAVLGRRMVRL